MTKDEKLEILRPLVALLCTSHYWRDHRHVAAPFTPLMLEGHAVGPLRYGLCPIAPGESTTRVGLLDFDSHKGATPWPDMLATADLVRTALEFDGHRPVMFRSSGGAGIHLYVFFPEPQDAYSVRRMLVSTLEVCGLKSGTAGVASGQVEVFPKQDNVPADGWGSMFVLPLAGASELLP